MNSEAATIEKEGFKTVRLIDVLVSATPGAVRMIRGIHHGEFKTDIVAWGDEYRRLMEPDALEAELFQDLLAKTEYKLLLGTEEDLDQLVSFFHMEEGAVNEIKKIREDAAVLATECADLHGEAMAGIDKLDGKESPDEHTPSSPEKKLEHKLQHVLIGFRLRWALLVPGQFPPSDWEQQIEGFRNHLRAEAMRSDLAALFGSMNGG